MKRLLRFSVSMSKLGLVESTRIILTFHVCESGFRHVRLGELVVQQSQDDGRYKTLMPADGD